jgi:hypothetical protein
MVTVMATTTPVISAQNQTAAATDPTLAALQLQQQQLAAQQAIMDAKLKMQQDQQALLTGALPASTATPNSGAFTVSGTNPFPSQKLAYGELLKVAKSVADKITSQGPIVLYDQTEINSLINYQAAFQVLDALQTQVKDLQTYFNDTLNPAAQTLLKPPDLKPGPTRTVAPVLAAGLVLGGLKTLSDIVGMFRTNTAIAYSTFTSDDAALTAAVANELVAAKKNVYQPAVMPLNVIDDSSAFMSRWSFVQKTLATISNEASLDQAKVQQVSDALNAYIQADVACQANHDQISVEADATRRVALQTKQTGLDRVREVARQYVGRLLGASPDAALDPATANVLKAERDAFLKVLGGFVTSTSTTAAAFGTLQTALMAVSSTGAAALTTILRAEKLFSVVKQPNAAILLVKTSVLGGSVVTRTNLFTGGHLLFTGGAIVNFTLFDATGVVKASGVVVGDSGKIKEKY